MSEDDWGDATPFPQLALWPCKSCDGQVTAHRVIIDRRTREPKQWYCDRCHTYTPLNLPFSPLEAPDGREQILAALKTMAIYLPIFMSVDQRRLYGITWRFFKAGWSVKDILYAIDYKPDDTPHETPAINPREPETILRRMQTRLRQWVWRDRYEDEEGGDIMPGPHTSMRTAMRARAEEQQVRALARDIEWAQQREMAQEARFKGAPMFARLAVEMAVEQAKKQRHDGDKREAEALAELVAWVKNQPGEAADEDESLPLRPLGWKTTRRSF
jgi:hypothetical protein